jgi:hypothetical protein
MEGDAQMMDFLFAIVVAGVGLAVTVWVGIAVTKDRGKKTA